MDTKRFIHVTNTVRGQLQREFDITRTTVWRALSFSCNGNVETAEKIRRRAYELGGILMAVNESVKTLYEHDGYMTQYLPNGAAIQCNLKNSTVVIRKGVDEIERYENVKMSQLPAIQARARMI